MTQHEGACSTGGSGGGSRPSTAAMPKHETGTVTKQTTGGRGGGGEGGSGGGFPPGTAAVSKHATGTVTGALQFMVAFTLRGGGGGYHTSGDIYHFVVPWEAVGLSPNQHASDLNHNFRKGGLHLRKFLQ